ncbi:MAG: PQQ-dependent sugar dehydrogenase [Saprospiraceae bacterium]|nr:PQQ-dependent sugar dehydrogenase [Saprospiraceae bacterium]
MPPFVGLGDSSINQIIAYLHTRKALLLSSRYSDRAEVTNPIPDTIEMSDLVCDLKLIAQFPTTGKEGVAPLARITKLDYEPHSGQTYVLDMNGKLYKLINDQPVVYMDLTKLIPNLLLQPGLSSGYNNFAFHPEFYKNGLLYTAHSEPAATKKADFAVDDTLEAAMQFVITEWKVSNPMQSSFEGQGRELFRIDMVSKAHGVQEIAFNPIAKPGTEDYGLLYISIGDAGAGENRYPFLLHSTRRAWGSLFRIDPNSQNQTARPSKNGHYGIPLSNPFASDPGAIGELYAYGFRNPHRITWTQKGQLLLSNIGHGDIEALDWVRPRPGLWLAIYGRRVCDRPIWGSD